GTLNLCHLLRHLVNSHTVCRNSENSSAMRGQSNGSGVRGFASPDRRARYK
ncbi:hypothetical protein CCACVL1_27451, partial [Corchorus capsularis]